MLSILPKIPVFFLKTGTNGADIFWKVSENLEIVDFLKSKPFNQKYLKFQEKIKWKGDPW